MESVELRQRGGIDFESHYKHLCSLQGTVPLSAVKSRLGYGLLDINGDRIRVDDWVPILNTLRINKSLDTVIVRSCYTHPTEEKGKKVCFGKKKPPAIRSKEITLRLCKSLCACLSVSPALSCIELCGLPLRQQDLQAIAKGVMANRTLKILSLELSRIGDSGLEILCQGIKNALNINTVTFTGCSLSWRGAESLAAVIKHQGIKRHNEAWQDSLRYRRPDLDRMSGLRRVTLNSNPLLGHQGAGVLAEALKDDLWLKALDMQACGISNSGAKALLEGLEYNTTLVVLDIRNNPLVDRDIIRSIMDQLMINSNGKENEYKWLPDINSPKDISKPKPRRRSTRVVAKSATRQTTIKVSVGSERAGRQSASRRLSFIGSSPKPGLPWRTAARAHRYRGFPPEPLGDDHDISEVTSSHLSITDYLPDSPSFLSQHPPSPSPAHHPPSSAPRALSATRTLPGPRSETRSTSQKMSLLEREMKLLLVENRGLREEVAYYRNLFDDSMLEAVEGSFRKMNAFLDMLEEAGLGKLISMGGLDRSQIPYSLLQQRPGSSKPPLDAAGHSPAKAPAPRVSPQAGAAGDVPGAEKLLEVAARNGRNGGNGNNNNNNNNNSTAAGQEGEKSITMDVSAGSPEKLVMTDASIEMDNSNLDYSEDFTADSPSKGM